MDITINGLMDGISVLETNKKEEPYIQSDLLYNDQEVGFQDFYYDEGYTVSNLDYNSQFEGVSLLSITN